MPEKKSRNLIVDVRPPVQPKLSQPYAKTGKKIPPLPNKRHRQLMILAAAAFFLVLSLNIFSFIRTAMASPALLQSKFAVLKTAIHNLQLEDARKAMALIENETQKIILRGKQSGLFYLTYLIKPLPKTIQNITILAQTTTAILDNVVYLEKNALDLIWKKKGSELIARLEKMQADLQLILETNKDIKINSYKLSLFSDSLADWSGLLTKNYAPIQLNIYRAQTAVTALLDILKKDNQHLLLLFQNESEIRPAGGFIGSFGDLVLNRGNLESIKIDDIYNADRQLNLNLIPPKELQGITKKWGARDANWFFDFPTSAKKVAYLLEQSDLFMAKNIKFQGVIAINTSVLKTLIDVAGPIALPAYQLELDSQNFLRELQREVEAGQDKKPGQNPKKILSVFAPVLMEKLKNLSDSQKDELLAAFRDHLAQKDIIFYSPNWSLQNLIFEAGIGGAIMELPENFIGDYLAVINANIGGGKTDAFIDQHISLKSRISPNGTIMNQLTVSRTHRGEREKDWWYRIPNKNYLKILTPPNSRLKNLQGNDESLAAKKSSYPTSYEKDPDLTAIENTASLISQFKSWFGSEFGKTYFATWLNVPAGQNKNLIVEYESGIKLNIQNGLRYQFVFEKQSGVDGSLEYSILAPPGYIWEESGEANFEYGTEQIQAREIIELTLVKSLVL